MLIDTHCHLYSEEFGDGQDEIVARGRAAGIGKFYLPAIDSGVIGSILALEARHPGVCYAMMGLHPCSVRADYGNELAISEEWLNKRPFAGIGETGLDFYWDRTFESEQYKAFHRQIEWGLHYRLPVIIHSRSSTPECIAAIREHQDGRLTGIFHCFSGTHDEARQIVDLGFHLGIGGVLTYKKSTLPDAIRDIPLEHLVLETDAPYLSPVPFRGKRNESSYMVYVADALAAVKGVGRAEVEEVTTKNAEKIFGG